MSYMTAVLDDIYFEAHFLEWKCLNSDWNFIEGFIFLKVLSDDINIGWDNGLAANRRQAIIWTSGRLVYWRIPSATNQLQNHYMFNGKMHQILGDILKASDFPMFVKSYMARELYLNKRWLFFQYQHNGAEDKWLPFWRRHFRKHFLERKLFLIRIY